MERTQFLARIDQRLTTPAPPNLPHPRVPGDGIPAITLTRPIGDPVEAFVRVAGQVGSTVREVSGEEDLEALLDEVVEVEGVRAATLSNDPEVDGLAGRLQGRGVEVVGFDGPHAISEVQLGVVGATHGIAATGTTVFDAGRAGGRTASLVPPAILVLVSARRIVAQPSDLFRHIDDHFPDGLPSQLVLASGPSRTGDIELVLTMGVHGPRSVWVAVLHDDGAAAEESS